MMEHMSFSETVFLFLLALVIFGPKKLPEIARFVAKTLGEFRRASNEFRSQIEQEIAHLEVETKKQTILPPSQAPENTASRTLNAASGEGSSATDTSATSDSSSSTSTSGEAPATLAASSDEVAPAMSSEPATEALSAEAVASSTSQESHA
jgi:TatA/E family protein of Tat protein translocase